MKSLEKVNLDSFRVSNSVLDHLVELNRIKVFYESEMCEARRLLDDQADEHHR